MRGQDVVEALDCVAATTPLPRSINADCGRDFMSRALEEFDYRRGVQLDFTFLSKPTDNTRIESFIGRLRDESLDVQQFMFLADARGKTEAWRCDYSQVQLHNSRSHLTPSEFIIQRHENRITEATALLH